MTTTLSWPGCRNARDLGGLAGSDGRTVLPRRLVRSDNLAGLDDHGYRAFVAYGVGRVIDLRGGIPSEPEPEQAADDAVSRIPWIDAARDHERDPVAERTLADAYCGSLDRNTRQVAHVMVAFHDAPAGAVVVHCAAGKDRTGMCVALLLDLVGVPWADIAADYAVSEEHLGILDALAGHPGPDGERERAERLWRTRPETILGALEHLAATYGGSARYLRDACGLSDAELDGIRDRLTRP